MNALRAGRRRLLFGRLGFRQHRGHQLLEIAALAEENAEGLIEQQCVFVPLHEDRMQRPVKIVTVADTRDANGFERLEHRARPDRNAGGSERAREVEDVIGELALRLNHGYHSAARRSDFTSSSSALTLLVSSRAMSS